MRTPSLLFMHPDESCLAGSCWSIQHGCYIYHSINPMYLRSSKISWHPCLKGQACGWTRWLKKRLQVVVKETLRLFPPDPITKLCSRSGAIEDCTLTTRQVLIAFYARRVQKERCRSTNFNFTRLFSLACRWSMVIDFFHIKWQLQQTRIRRLEFLDYRKRSTRNKLNLTWFYGWI